MSYFLGIDVSTTGVKALLMSPEGSVAATAVTPHPSSSPRPLWSEQNPEDWWRAACASIKEVLARAAATGAEVTAVGLAGQQHSMVLLDADGAVLRPAMMWNDQRAGAECAELFERAGGLDRVLELTGNPMLTNFPAAKMLWVRCNEPEVWERVAHFLGVKDYVRYRLTGEYATDVTEASGTSLFDVGRRQWSWPMLDLIGMPHGWMPRALEGIELSGHISARGAEATGLRPGTPVVAGTGDGDAHALACGLVRPGPISLSSGTSGVLVAHTTTYSPEAQGRLQTLCAPIPGRWHAKGVILAAGGSFRWFRDALGEPESATARLTGEDPYDLLTRQAARVPLGSDGLLFLPYLSGERTPHPDPRARGAFVGITTRHGKGHMIRAVMEGVAFGLRDTLELFRGIGLPIAEVRVSGGGARSALWLQIKADIFKAETALPSSSEGAAFGAALLAATATGCFASVEEAVDSTVRVTGRTAPIPENVRRYEELYQIYRSLYPALRPAFHALSG